MRRWIERYRDANRRQVWTETTSLGPGLRSDETALSEAAAVAGETMRRARNNVERLVERLPRFGFEFESVALADPSPDARTELDTLEREIGLLPL